MKLKAFSALLLSILLLTAALLTMAQGGRSVFSWVIADKATVQSGGLTVTGASQLADTTVTGDATISDDLTVTDDAVFGSDITASPQTTITVIMNGYITPTGTLQLLSAAGAVSLAPTHILSGTQGDLLILLNVGAQTITITETTGLISAGNIALGAGDSATLVWRLNSWYEIASSNN